MIKTQYFAYFVQKYPLLASKISFFPQFIDDILIWTQTEWELNDFVNDLNGNKCK